MRRRFAGWSPTFQDNIPVPASRVEQSKQMGRISCLAISMTDCQPMPRKHPKRTLASGICQLGSWMPAGGGLGGMFLIKLLIIQFTWRHDNIVAALFMWAVSNRLVYLGTFAASGAH